MRPITFLLCACMLTVSALLPQQSGGYQERAILVFFLGQEVRQFILESRLSGEDKRTVSRITISLLSDPPLKTIQEIMEKGQQIARPVKDDDEYRTYEKILEDKKVQAVLKEIRTALRPSPMLTQHQARDLKRLLDLRAALGRHNLRSTAADKLYDLIIADIRATRES